METNDQCLISNAFTVEMDKNKEYMFIYNGKTDQVFQFDKSGKFIRELGRQGNGPGEHNVVLSLAIDDEKRKYIHSITQVPPSYTPLMVFS